jgi:type III pantothenate kinase
VNYTIDQGNSQIKGASFERDTLKGTSFWQSEQEVLSHFEKIRDSTLIICSVSGNPASLQNILSKQNKIVILDHKTPLPIVNEYKSPETLGMDRLAAVCGANYLYPNDTCLVVDMGTCITYEVIDHQKIYQGGIISPGYQMRFNAMHNQTSDLPLLKESNAEFLIGQTTKSSMVSGVVNGIINEIDGFILRFKERYGDLKVILTGGDSKRFESKLKAPTFAAANLVHIGLNSILRYNEGSA